MPWRGTRCFCRFGSRDNLWPGIFCKGDFSFSFPSWHHFLFSLTSEQDFSTLLEGLTYQSTLFVSSYIKITRTRVNLLKANSPEVSRASLLICTLDFQESAWSFQLHKETGIWTPRLLTLMPTPWISLHSNPRQWKVLVDNSAPVCSFTKNVR